MATVPQAPPRGRLPGLLVPGPVAVGRAGPCDQVSSDSLEYFKIPFKRATHIPTRPKGRKLQVGSILG
eukprot:55087-Heterocapsa_arctica.AAC.1